MSNSTRAVVTALILVACAVAYMVWLNAGCDVAGVMTWHGKQCV